MIHQIKIVMDARSLVNYYHHVLVLSEDVENISHKCCGATVILVFYETAVILSIMDFCAQHDLHRRENRVAVWLLGLKHF